MVLSAFYWGYAPPQIFGGWLSQKLGGRLSMAVVLFGITVSALGIAAVLHHQPQQQQQQQQHMTSPLSASESAQTGLLALSLSQQLVAITALRFVDGLCQCLFVPTTYVLYNRKVNPANVSKYKAAISLGARMARFAAAAVVPWLAHTAFQGQLGALFGIVGLIAAVVLVLWLLLLPKTKQACQGVAPPAASAALTRSETARESSSEASLAQPTPAHRKASASIPLFGAQFWKLVIYGPSMAIAVVHFSGNWMSALLESYSLRYYTDVANVSRGEAAVYSSSPMMVGFISPFFCVAVEVALSTKLRFNKLQVRRFHSCVALLFMAAAMAAFSARATPNVFFWSSAIVLLGSGLHTAGYAANYGEIGGRSVFSVPLLVLRFPVAFGPSSLCSWLCLPPVSLARC